MALLMILGGIVWLWHFSRMAHEKVLQISQAVCKDLNVQLLDESVALHRIGLTLLRQGPVVRRLYFFDFSSDGSNRRRGEIALHGKHIEWVRIEHPDGNFFVYDPPTEIG